MTLACVTAELADQDFHRAWEHVMKLWSVGDDDDDDGGGDDGSVCASGCVYRCSVMNIPIPDGWLYTRRGAQTLSTSMRLQRPASVSPPR